MTGCSARCLSLHSRTGVYSRPPLPSAFGKQVEEPGARGGADAAFGDQAGHQPRRRDIESIVHRRAAGRREPNGDAPPVLGPTFDMGDLATVAALDWDRGTTLDFPVDGERGEGDVARNVVVAGRQRRRVE